MRQGRAKDHYPLRGPVSLIYCYLSKHRKKLGKSGKLFQIRITYDLLATRDSDGGKIPTHILYFHIFSVYLPTGKKQNKIDIYDSNKIRRNIRS